MKKILSLLICSQMFLSQLIADETSNVLPLMLAKDNSNTTSEFGLLAEDSDSGFQQATSLMGLASGASLLVALLLSGQGESGLPMKNFPKKGSSFLQFVGNSLAMIGLPAFSISFPLAIMSSSSKLTVNSDVGTSPMAIAASLDLDPDLKIRYEWTIERTGTPKDKFLFYTDEPEFKHIFSKPGAYALRVIAKRRGDSRVLHDLSAQFTIPNNLPVPTFSLTAESDYAPAKFWADKEVSNPIQTETVASCKWLVNNEERACNWAQDPSEFIFEEPGEYTVILEITDAHGLVGQSEPQNITVKDSSPIAKIVGCQFDSVKSDPKVYMRVTCAAFFESLGSISSDGIEWAVGQGDLTTSERHGIATIDFTGPTMTRLYLTVTDSNGRSTQTGVLLDISDHSRLIED